jgi:hypothetical protein
LSANKRRSLIRPFLNSNGFKEQVFGADNWASNGNPTDTRITSAGKGYSPICPISVLDVSSASDEFQYVLDVDEGVQLSLPFNVYYIDRSLSLAPNGCWSELDFIWLMNFLLNLNVGPS